MTIDETNQSYHHGDLARAVLQQVERTIEARGIEAVSLRACAKTLGVSHSAVFRHFNSKRAVLTAFAAQSADDMAAFIEGKVLAASENDRFMAVGLAYVEFAKMHPGRFKAVFREDALDATNEAYLKATERLNAFLATGGHGGGNNLAISPKALLAWSCVHGLATLCVDGSLSRDLAEDKFLKTAEQTLRLLFPVLGKN